MSRLKYVVTLEVDDDEMEWLDETPEAQQLAAIADRKAKRHD